MAADHPYLDRIARAASAAELERARVSLLGRKGELTAELRGLGGLPEEKRRAEGARLNRLREAVQQALRDRADALQAEPRAADAGALPSGGPSGTRNSSADLPSGPSTNSGLPDDLSNAGRPTDGLSGTGSLPFDATLPPQGYRPGSLHPLTAAEERICAWFAGMGYQVLEGPEIEDDWHNFEALNIPEDHPARAMHDTFYLQGGLLLRTHTSPMQVRVMKSQRPPIAVVCPGRVYRRDSDVTHTPMFHQVEGLFIDRGLGMADLKGTLAGLCEHLFGARRLRFRASYFPFTEPSAEVDIACACEGAGCRTCSGSGWLEILGCGMVHPRVLELSGLDADEYSGFAFGLGVERIAMLRHGLDDMRLNFENDLRFLRQFGPPEPGAAAAHAQEGTALVPQAGEMGEGAAVEEGATENSAPDKAKPKESGARGRGA